MKESDQSTGSAAGGIDLWCAYPGDLLPEAAAQACAALLGNEERERAARFRFERHRREYLAAHALIRVALSHRHPLPGADWQFETNAYGKPAAFPACGLHFNLSDAERLVVCLVAQDAEVGVDLEPLEQAASIAGLAPQVFSPREQAQLDALHGAGRNDRALSLWTLKEAYIKARGFGLSLPLDRFSFIFDDSAGIHLELAPELNDTPEHWRFCLLDHAGHRIALVVESKSASQTHPGLRIWEARPPLATPRRLPLDTPQWFPRAAAQ